MTPPAAKREPARAPGTPSAAPSTEDLAEIVRPEVTLDDVAGMDDVKQRLRLGFLEPLRNEELREVFGQSLRSSLVLWGPPGCGKTFLAKALAGELGLFFIHDAGSPYPPVLVPAGCYGPRRGDDRLRRLEVLRRPAPPPPRGLLPGRGGVVAGGRGLCRGLCRPLPPSEARGVAPGDGS